MCKFGDHVVIEVLIPADLSYTGKKRFARKPIDRCLVNVVKLLKSFGIETRSCCCGHGRERGTIQVEKTDNIIRFLDSEYIAVLFRNELGSYTAAMGKGDDFDWDDGLKCPESQMTDADTPSRALEALCTKFLNRVRDP